MLSEPVLLYDGTCGFCSGIVQFVLRRDRKATLKFAALDGDFAVRVRRAFPQLHGVDSMVWVDEGMRRVFVRSAAALQIARYLGGAWRLAAAWAIVPGPLRDRLYDLVARHRHHLTVRQAACFVPGPDVLHRFL
ncbi:MAG TPA: DCC1-like thiol-disulfide oxidoreductase family protein [Gemmatimonadales bacterium]|jgi:predicted DCC family thiol-disulfide oxidoreductase YuxK